MSSLHAIELTHEEADRLFSMGEVKVIRDRGKLFGIATYHITIGSL